MGKVGFVGLGVMGGPMAGHLFHKGHDLVVWNRSPERRAPLQALGVPIADSLADLGAQCDTICLCVNRTEDVRACLDDLTKTAAPGTLVIDHSTILADAAEAMHRDLADRGLHFLDSPITGGSMGAQKGALTIFCGGQRADFERAEPLLAAYAKTAELVGGPGAGQRMKAANQIAVGGALLALCESLNFAGKAGLDLAQTRRLLAGGAAGSWAFENYGPKILDRDWSPGFTIDNQLKDFAYCEETALAIDAALPGTMLVGDLLRQLQAEGHGGWTTCALFALMERMSAAD